MIIRSQVFDADEAAQLLFAFDYTGDIPGGYDLQLIDGYLVDGTGGTSERLGSALHRALARADLPHVRLHDARHSCATLM